jgi:chromosome segregation ATPase
VKLFTRRPDYPDLSADLAWAESVIADLNTELEQTAVATKAMHNQAQTTIGTLRAEKTQLHEQIRVAQAALKHMASRVDNAQAEVKRLDARLVATEMDLGKARDDNRALQVQLANALNAPPPAALTGKPVLTPAQRADAADDAAWKRIQDGAGDPQ